MDVSTINGIDTLVEQYRTSERKPAILMETRKSTLQIRLSALSELQTKLKALFNSATDLTATGSGSKFHAATVASSDEKVFTATATALAAVGAHSLKVQQLAKADTLLSSGMTAADTGAITAEGAGLKTFSVTVGGKTTNVNVTLADGDTNGSILSKIASAVNTASAGVTASVVKVTDTTSRLVLSSSKTGSTNTVALANVAGTLLDQIGWTSDVLSGRTAASSSVGGYSTSNSTLLDSKFELDGIAMTRTSNSISDALSGVKIVLKAAQATGDAATTMTVARDSAAVSTSVKDFFTKYNAVLTYLRDKTAVDPDTKTHQVFSEDQTILRMRNSLRVLPFNPVTSVQTGNPSVLTSIGVTVGTDGGLTLTNATTFEDALAADPAKIADLFNSTSGIAVSMKSLLKDFTSSDGVIGKVSDDISLQIKNLGTRITNFDARLDKKVEAYRSEFVKLQQTLVQLQSQSTQLQSLINSMNANSYTG
jgi:flagellar hook-associated protein 2